MLTILNLGVSYDRSPLCQEGQRVCYNRMLHIENVQPYEFSACITPLATVNLIQNPNIQVKLSSDISVVCFGVTNEDAERKKVCRLCALHCIKLNRALSLLVCSWKLLCLLECTQTYLGFHNLRCSIEAAFCFWGLTSMQSLVSLRCQLPMKKNRARTFVCTCECSISSLNSKSFMHWCLRQQSFIIRG